MKIPSFALGLVVCAATLPAGADPQLAHQGVMKRFDANRDGRLDPAEREQARAHLASRPSSFGRSAARLDESPTLRRQRVMERYDLDGNGRLSPEEATRAREAWTLVLERTSAQIESGLRPTAAPVFPSTDAAAAALPTLPGSFGTLPTSETRGVTGASDERGASDPFAAASTRTRAPSTASPAPSFASRTAGRPAPPATSRTAPPATRTTAATPKPKADPFYNQPAPAAGAPKGAKGGGRGGPGAPGGGPPPGGGGRGGARGPLF